MSEHIRTPASLPGQIKRIILTGFMGAGKSTAGALLAQRLGWAFADADHFIEARAGTTVAEIFRRDGEDAFRKLEADAIEELTRREFLVLAPGGGAVETPSTRELLRRLPETRIVFLEAPLDILVARCAEQPGAAVRPVLAERKRLEERLAMRLPLYREAHLTVLTRDIPVKAVVDSILQELHAEAEKTMKENITA